jgi:hypothetical protein
MHARLALLTLSALVALPASALAQGSDDEWAAGAGGHLAFVTQAQDDGISNAFFVGTDGHRSGPEPISTGSGSPVVAVGPRGDALFLWYDRDERLWARYRSAVGALGGPELVAERIDGGAETNVLAVDGAGTATVTYLPDDGTGGLHVRTRSEAGAWSPAQNLGGADVFGPQLDVAANGFGVLAWRQGADQLMVSTRAPGAAGFAPATALTAPRKGSYPSEVAANDKGDAIVGWGTETAVYGRFRSPDGRFGPRTKLSRSPEMGGPYATVLASGRMVLGFTRGYRGAEARVRYTSGKLGPLKRITRDLAEATGVFPLAVGSGAVGWADRDPNVSTLRIAYATPNGRFSEAKTITRARGWTVGPAFAVTPQGPVAVAQRPLKPTDPIRWVRVP